MPPPLDETPACLSCGTCCFSNLPEYVPVTGDDHARLGEAAATLTHFLGNRCYMRLDEGHCAALVVDPDRGELVCSVYDARPATCRDLARGSPACRAEIHEKGERPLVLLANLRARPC